jgi:3',5'-cyclic AMP phosphodiesterase CpdA
VTLSVLQLTDPHFGADWAPAAPADTLREVLGAVRRLAQRPAVALLTGDLTNDGAEQDYTALAALLAEELELPLQVIPGNHDDRAQLRRWFDVGGEGAEPIQYAVELEGLRVLMLDTTIPGEGTGALGAARLEWIAAALAERPEVPTILAMHHPPFITGVKAMDRFALIAADREACARLVSEHPQVCGTIAGHVHRAMATAVGGRPAVTIPSTYCQLPLDFAADRLGMIPDPVAFAVHALVDGRLVSQLQTLPVTA